VFVIRFSEATINSIRIEENLDLCLHSAAASDKDRRGIGQSAQKWLFQFCFLHFTTKNIISVKLEKVHKTKYVY
jgi:hypothetical protein